MSLAPLAPGRRLQRLRHAHGWSVGAIAAAAQVSPSAVRMWEAGHRSLPRAMVTWLRTVPPPRSPAVYAATAAGLDQAMRARRLGPRQVAAVLGVTAGAVWQWRVGRYPLHPGVRAWLRAGAPTVGYAVPLPPRVDWVNGEVA